MADIDTILAAFGEWRGAKLALATVLRSWGSAPCPPGSHMLVHEDGRFAGSVSGGCVEGDVLVAAAETMADGRPRPLRFGVADEIAWEAGLPCGGEIEILVQPVGENGFPPHLFGAISAARSSGTAFTVSTDLANGRSVAGESEGAWRAVYPPPRRLLVVGAVRIAQSLARIAAEIGVACTVIDPRGRFLTEERFPDVARDDRWPDEAIAALRPDASTAVVVLSHDPKIDDPALAAAIGSPAAYIGALGSRKNHAARLDRLRAQGFDEAALGRIDGPVGLDIGARGPAEIALSITAAMVAAMAETPVQN